jgi:hypothetical protein
MQQLPFETDDLIIRQATSHFILIESKDMHVAYDGNAVYIRLESIYRERIRGLCGSFDYNRDNDLRLPNGKLTCDTDIFSGGYLINKTQPISSSEEDTPKKFDRSKAVCIFRRFLRLSLRNLLHCSPLGEILPSYQRQRV